MNEYVVFVWLTQSDNPQSVSKSQVVLFLKNTSWSWNGIVISTISPSGLAPCLAPLKSLRFTMVSVLETLG